MQQQQKQQVRLFRRTKKNSFSVQLSPTSGVVEVHCSRVDVVPNTFAAREELEENLLLISSSLSSKKKRQQGGGGGACVLGENEWMVELRELGPFSMESHGFVQCHIVFSKKKTSGSEKEETNKSVEEKEEEEDQPLLLPTKKKSLRWVQVKE